MTIIIITYVGERRIAWVSWNYLFFFFTRQLIIPRYLLTCLLASRTNVSIITIIISLLPLFRSVALDAHGLTFRTVLVRPSPVCRQNAKKCIIEMHNGARTDCVRGHDCVRRSYRATKTCGTSRLRVKRCQVYEDFVVNSKIKRFC